MHVRQMRRLSRITTLRNVRTLRRWGINAPWYCSMRQSERLSVLNIFPELHLKSYHRRYFVSCQPGQIKRVWHHTAQIIDQLLVDIPPENPQPRNTDLVALLLTSSTIHYATLPTLWKYITIPHSRVFRKFLDRIKTCPQLGNTVRRLDFSHFKRSYGQSAFERSQVKDLTEESLLQCIIRLPNLEEFLAREEIEEDMSSDVLRTLFNMPKMKAMDFCGARSSAFVDALNGIFDGARLAEIPQVLNVTRLSFHECTSMPASIFTTLMPRLLRLTILDVANTRISIQALNSLPPTVRLTHLNLSRCYQLAGTDLVQFLTRHPSTKSLVYLNLHADTRIHRILDEDHLADLLPHLPHTLRSLNLKGSGMNSSHLDLLKPLIFHLEELSVGSLSYHAVARLLLRPCKEMLPPFATGSDNAKLLDELADFKPHILKYLDISDLPLSSISTWDFLDPKLSLLRTPTTIDVLELHPSFLDHFAARSSTLARFGWICKNEGRRGWLVRNPAAKAVEQVYNGTKADKWSWKIPEGIKEGELCDNGARMWKMGARWWGMRKVPVSDMEVGGVYGWFMFNRA